MAVVEPIPAEIPPSVEPLPTSESREATAQLLRRNMLEALIACEGDLSAEQLNEFRALCKDYEAPGRSTLESLEARVAALENAGGTTKVERYGPLQMGP